MAKADPRTERAAKLADVLRTQRESGISFPTASRLRDLLDPQITDEDLFKTLTHDSLVVAAKKDLSAPVALAEDAEQLAASDALLEYAMSKLASADKPLHRIDRVVGKVEKALQPAFQASLEKRLAENALPASIGTHDVKEERHLYLKQFPPPPPKKSPAQEMAERLLAALAARREQNEPVVPLGELSTEEPGLIKKGAAHESFGKAAVLLPVTKALTLVALTGDQSVLLESDRVLTALLESRTSAKKPYVSPADLTTALPEQHREAFLRGLANRIESGDLPAGVTVRVEAGQQVLCLASNVPDTQLLGEKLLAALQKRRDSGTDDPIRLDALARAEAPDASADLVARLANDKTFKSKTLSALPGRPDAPVALPGDEAKLGGSRATLEFAVGLLSTPETPLHPLKKIAGKLDAAVRPAFEETVTKHVTEGTLPATLAHHDVKGQPHLRRGDYPLPPPPEEALAERLFAAMGDARNDGIYPTSVNGLLGRIGAQPAEKLLRSAMAHNAFRARVIVALAGDVDSPAALVEDRGRLASEPRLLEYVLSRVSSSDNQALLIADLCKALAPDLRPDFTVAVGQFLASAALPPTVCCLVIKKKPYLFLKSDLEARPVIAAVTEQERRLPESAEEQGIEENEPEDVNGMEEQEEPSRQVETVEQANLF